VDLYLLPLIAPLLLLAAGGAGFVSSGLRPRWLLKVAEWASISAIAVALLTVVLVLVEGAG